MSHNPGQIQSENYTNNHQGNAINNFFDRNPSNDLNNSPNLNSKPQNNPKKPDDPRIKKFKESLENDYSNNEYKTVCLDINKYQQIGTENGFAKFDRSLKTNTEMTRQASNPISPVQSVDENPEKTIIFDSKFKLNQLKQIYLAHMYDETPELFNQQLLVDQINSYLFHESISLAHFHGFSLKNCEGEFIPTVLTARPVNGPLSSLFETIQLNQSKEGQNNRSDLFNLGSVSSIDPDQKFAMICGIVNGIAFIHENHFIHSNLNPTTVYLDENLFPLICDYVFVPPFEVTTVSKDSGSDYSDDSDESDSDSSNKEEYNEFIYRFDKEKGLDVFKNILYVAPEILNGEQFNSAVDIYSLGLLMFFIVTGKEATFDSEKHLIYPEGFSNEWKEMINKCISVDVSKRPTAFSILEELFDKEKKNAFLSSINPESGINSLSDKVESYFSLFKNSKVRIEIFHTMIPNVIDIDNDTKLTILAAENGNAKCIEKVGDYFFKGLNNLHQDEGFAYYCYSKASKRGRVNSSILAAKFNEEGIGMDINFLKAEHYYELALSQMSETDPKRSEIKQKIILMNELNRTLIIFNIPLDQTKENIKEKIFLNFDVEIKPIERSENDDKASQKMKVIFKSNDDLDRAKKHMEKYPENYIIDETNKKTIEFETVSAKIMNESHRYKSLSTSLTRIDLNDYIPILIANPKDKKKKTYVILGSGKYADTYKVVKKGTENEFFAAKVYKEKIPIQELNLFKREIIMASKFDHPCIIKYIGFNEHSLIQTFEGTQTNEVMPTLMMVYVKNDTIDKAISEKNPGFDETARLKAIIGIANALCEMYEKRIVHRDLKLQNILLNDNFEPVICDLGYSRQFTSMHDKMTRYIGTPLYMAPELFLPYECAYSYEVDVYAFGIIVYQILAMVCTAKLNIYPPVTKYEKLLEYKLNNRVPIMPDSWNKQLKSLIKSCWNVEKDVRPDPPTIYNDLVDMVENDSEPLLPNADMDAVKRFINTLPKVQRQ